MDIRTAITTAVGAVTTPAFPTSAGSFRLGLTSRSYAFPAADVIVAGVLKFAADDVRDLDVEDCDITDPATPTTDQVEGFTGLDADGNAITIALMYALAIRAPASNVHSISVTNIGIWAAGPLGLGGATVAGEGLHVKPGGEIILTNPLGWAIAGGGANQLRFTADATTGASTLEVVIIGIDVAPA